MQTYVVISQWHRDTTKQQRENILFVSTRYHWIAHCSSPLNCYRGVWRRPDYSGCLIFLNNFPYCKFKNFFFFKTCGFCAFYLRVYLLVNSASVVTPGSLSQTPYLVVLILSYSFYFITGVPKRDLFHVPALWRVIPSSFVTQPVFNFIFFCSFLLYVILTTVLSILSS